MSKTSGKICVIACGVLKLDLQQAAEKLNISVDFKFLESSLHDTPARLRDQLQQAINLVPPDQYDRIVVGYGICGQGTDGIIAPKLPLVVPQVHDCIALFLGSAAAYKEQFEKHPGTYYFTAGWLEKGIGPDNMQKWMLQVCPGYSEKEIAELMNEFFSGWQKNYSRAAFIKTAVTKDDNGKELAKTTAQKYGWKYEEILGSARLFEKMLTADKSDDEILLVPPGFKIVFDAQAGKLQAISVKN